MDALYSYVSEGILIQYTKNGTSRCRVTDGSAQENSEDAFAAQHSMCVCLEKAFHRSRLS